MTTAQNIKELHDGGYTEQAMRMCEAESVSVEIDSEVEKTYIFSDGSHVSCAYGEMWLV
jgi:hypothetical protein